MLYGILLCGKSDNVHVHTIDKLQKIHVIKLYSSPLEHIEPLFKDFNF